jgi:hypothetical protein
MGFSVFVEMLNLQLRHGKGSPIRFHEAFPRGEGS